MRQVHTPKDAVAAAMKILPPITTLCSLVEDRCVGSLNCLALLLGEKQEVHDQAADSHQKQDHDAHKRAENGQGVRSAIICRRRGSQQCRHSIHKRKAQIKIFYIANVESAARVFKIRESMRIINYCK